MDKKESLNKFKNWDKTTIWILVLSGILLIFSFFSPLIFTLPNISESVNFTETGQIGDTIGGILNPFIALVGILLTFLAFYMQIKANQIQITQFEEGLRKDKEIRNAIEKKDLYNKLSLLKTDLLAIQHDVKTKADNLKSYYEKEKESPFESISLMRTPSKNYGRILAIDRLSVYNAFNMFLSHRENWISDFSNLYNILEFLPEFFKTIYQKYEHHVQDKFKTKMDVRTNLIKLMDSLANLINDYLADNSEEDYLDFPASNLANLTIKQYYKVIEEDFDEDGNSTRETDFSKIDETVLIPFMKEVFKQRKEPNFDRRLETIVETAGNLRKQISLVKQRSIEFAHVVEGQYNSLMIDDTEKSYMTMLEEINSILDTELSRIKLED